ncbi:HAMP domain-containing histidine kinase, partial [candidate division KSB1 bacterium]|nr:HAMP domain-containing histidine kinase [candidate division KSB1 bacterium]
GQLAAGIAHEINNPLGVVLMYSHLMLDEIAPDSEKREDLHMIAEHADRAKKIVSGLLNFARQNKVNLKEIEIPKLIQDSIKTIVFPENIKVQINHRLKNPIAELDRDQMIQVFTNFVNNSITAMKDGGILTLETEDDDNFVRFYIKDTGSGIRKENLAKIFEPFFTTKKLGKGTGLGLAITYGILKMHHGDISVESNTDPTAGSTGTTFKMTLPRRGIRS